MFAHNCLGRLQRPRHRLRQLMSAYGTKRTSLQPGLKGPQLALSGPQDLLVFCPSCTVQCIELFIRQLDIDGGDILFQMRDLAAVKSLQDDGIIRHAGLSNVSVV